MVILNSKMYTKGNYDRWWYNISNPYKFKIKDQIILNNTIIIDSLDTEILTRDFMINDLTNDLKIAGVRVDAAERRADAVQRTAEKIKTNTIIEVKGVERDTTNKDLRNE